MVDPLVSCLMVTQPARARFWPRCLADYAWQTHARRELVIVLDQRIPGGAGPLHAAIAATARDDIRVVTPPAGLSLGALRNVSRGAARGDVTLQWDDDDRHHPDRIAHQLAAWIQSGAPATCLTQVVQYAPALALACVTNWVGSPPRCMPATLLCARTAPIVYPEAGPCSDRHEDRAVVEQLAATSGVHGQADEPHLYVYVSHGANTSGDAHIDTLAGQLGLSRGLLARREAALRAGLAPFGLTGTTITGTNGPAFTL